jgi:tetratricopeptide (TPR) repeat protein
MRFVERGPTNIPSDYDEARVAQLHPLKDAIDGLGLPPIRVRKLHGIVNALEMQIEDGGDSPEVNALLLRALRAGVVHQVDRRRGRAVLRAIGDLERVEAEHWKQDRTEISQPADRSPEKQLADLVRDGYGLERRDQTAAACDRWLEAWGIVKELAAPSMRTTDSFNRAYRGLTESIYNWTSDLEMYLQNAGVDDPIYHEHRLRFVRELLALFPDEDDDRYLQFKRAEGEALWALGREEEAEQLCAALVDRLPDEAWAYVAWADKYWLMDPPDPPQYGRAEEIMRRALKRPNLRDRVDLLERLIDLYDTWGKPEQLASVQSQVDELRQSADSGVKAFLSGMASKLSGSQKLAPAKKPGRNEPCWCGSGKKYKHCHKQSDDKSTVNR